MKRILLALTMVGLLLPLAPRVDADTEVSLNFFYDNLSPYGSWIDVAGYGYCFQPSVAVDDADCDLMPMVIGPTLTLDRSCGLRLGLGARL
jgi:hypothetical protein